METWGAEAFGEAFDEAHDEDGRGGSHVLWLGLWRHHVRNIVIMVKQEALVKKKACRRYMMLLMMFTKMLQRK